MLMILVQWILHKILNHLSQCHLGVRLDLCIFDCGSSSEFSRWQRSINDGKCTVLPSYFRQLPCRYFLEFFSLFFHCCLCCWNFYGLRQTNPSVKTFRFCEFSVILEYIPFLSGYKQILRPLLVLRILAVWIWYPWLLLPSFDMLMFLVLWILYKIRNHLLQCRLEVQLDLCIFCALSPIRHSSNDRCPSVRQNELLCPSSLLHRSPLICFWLLFCPTAESFQVSPILYPLLLLLRESSLLEGKEYIVYHFLLQWFVPISCNMVLIKIR